MDSLTRRELKRLASLQHKKYRLEYRQCVLEGLRLCEEALDSEWTIHAMFVTDEFGNQYRDSHIFSLADQRTVDVQTISNADMDRITSSRSAQGIALLVELPSRQHFDLRNEISGPVLLLDSISDPGNLGTLLRSADWFGVRHVVLGPHSVEWSNPKVLRSTMGAVFRVRIYEATDLSTSLNLLHQAGYRIFAADMQGHPLWEYQQERLGDNWALLLGNEAHGISKDLSSRADVVYTIPGAGSADSLNVAIAGAVFLYEFHRP